MASEYKKRGGDYTTDKETGQDESQKNLQKWGEEEWQTKDGEGEAKQDDGSRKRYLPKKAWEQMDEEEKQETEDKKLDASKKGQQFVGNTEKAKQSRKNANEEESEEFEQKKNTKSKGNKTDGSASVQDDEQVREQNEDDAEEEDEEDEEEDEEANDDEDEDMEEAKNDGEEKQPKQRAGKKRGRKPKAESDANKSQKANSGKGKDTSNGTHGSKHDSNEAPAEQGSANRLPSKGDRVSWKALPGWVHGKLVEVVTSRKTVNGKDVKGSKGDPRFVLESDSGKTCVHKPEACYYD